jgi:hypothetical protein
MSTTLELWAAVKFDAAGNKVNGYNVGATSRPALGTFQVVLDNALDPTEIGVTVTPSYAFGSLTPPKLVYAYALDPSDQRTLEIKIFGLTGLALDADFDVVAHRFIPG